jgi:hypothetical protein
MCDAPVPCQCTLERRAEARKECIARQEALLAVIRRLRDLKVPLSEKELVLLLDKAEEEWDDAIHIASPDDPLVSLCGRRGRNLADLPDRPDSWSGCWGCLTRADALESADEKELVNA